MSSLFSKIALGLALGAALAGCAAAHGSSAAGSMAAATARATPASHAAGESLVSTGATPTSASWSAQPPATTAPALRATSVADVGVVAACDGPAPLALSTEPASISLACADDGLGIQDLHWTSWSDSTATGTGLLWENLCDPNCAEGTYGHYPVAVTLSAVKDSAKGAWFSRLSVTWRSSRPHNQTPDSYTLTRPTS